MTAIDLAIHSSTGVVWRQISFHWWEVIMYFDKSVLKGEMSSYQRCCKRQGALDIL